MVKVIILYKDNTWKEHEFEISDEDFNFLYNECSKYEWKEEQDYWFKETYFSNKNDPRIKNAIGFIFNQ